MSFELDWEKVKTEFSTNFTSILNSKLNGFVVKNKMLQSFTVSNLDFGLLIPEINLVDISDPFDEFYENDLDYLSNDRNHVRSDSEDNDEESVTLFNDDLDDADYNSFDHQDHRRLEESIVLSGENNTNNSTKSKDFQAVLQLTYNTSNKDEVFKGSSFQVDTVLGLDIPTSMFVSIPIKLRIRFGKVKAQIIVACIKKVFKISIKFTDESTPDLKSTISNMIKIESEIGEPSKHVMRNVEKIEAFLVEQAGQLLTNELIFPKYYEIKPTM